MTYVPKNFLNSLSIYNIKIDDSENWYLYREWSNWWITKSIDSLGVQFETLKKLMNNFKTKNI